MPVTLLGYPVSPFVRKVRVAFETKGIPYKLDPVVPYTDREKVLRHNPSGTVPVLLPGDGAAPITESAEIVAWSESIAPDPRLIPAAPADRARALRIQSFADSRMAQAFGGMMIGQRIIVPFYFGEPHGKEEVVAKAMGTYAPPLLDEVASLLEEEEFSAGGFSIADIAMASWLRGAQITGFHIDPARWPSLTAWLVRCYARPGFASVIADEETTDPVIWARARYGQV